MLQKTAITITVFILLAFTGCKKNKRQPLITTLNVSNITISTADCGGVLYAEGDAPVTEKGLCWSDAYNPTIDDHKLECGSGEGSFTGQMTDLMVSHTYYVRAYAINKFGVAYGKSMLFTTSASVFASIVTMQPSFVATNTAVCGGTVTSVSPLSEKGICYGTSPYPTISNSVARSSNGVSGGFTVILTGLMPGTIYYACAYAINASGVSYGSTVAFSTYWGSVTDADGNTYMTVKIGNQVWMAENLRVSKFNDGTPVTKISDAAGWSSTNAPAWCTYQNNDAYGTTYGKLYNWHTVNAGGTGKDLAPAGWHVPDEDEWQTLYDYCNSAPSYYLLEKGYSHWTRGGGMDYYMFTALGAGSRSSSGLFSQLNQVTGFWTTTNTLSTGSYFYMDNDLAFISQADKKLGYSIRCIKN